MRKPTINQKRVSEKIKKAILSGELINKSRIARECGYSDKSAKAMKPYVNKTYKEEEVSITKMLERERNRIMRALENKDLDKERYATLVDALDKLTKNHQLLLGESTENVEYRIIEG